jgi:hypothetical protein
MGAARQELRVKSAERPGVALQDVEHREDRRLKMAGANLNATYL